MGTPTMTGGLLHCPNCKNGVSPDPQSRFRVLHRCACNANYAVCTCDTNTISVTKLGLQPPCRCGRRIFVAECPGDILGVEPVPCRKQLVWQMEWTAGSTSVTCPKCKNPIRGYHCEVDRHLFLAVVIRNESPPKCCPKHRNFDVDADKSFEAQREVASSSLVVRETESDTGLDELKRAIRSVLEEKQFENLNFRTVEDAGTAKRGAEPTLREVLDKINLLPNQLFGSLGPISEVAQKSSALEQAVTKQVNSLNRVGVQLKTITESLAGEDSFKETAPKSVETLAKGMQQLREILAKSVAASGPPEVSISKAMAVIAEWNSDPLRRLLSDLPELFSRLEPLFLKCRSADAATIDWLSEIQNLELLVHGWQQDHKLVRIPEVGSLYDPDEAVIINTVHTDDPARHRTIKEVVEAGYAWKRGDPIVLKPGRVVIWSRDV